MFSQSHVVEKIFQTLRVRLKLSIRWAMKIKLFITCEIQYFERGIFSFNSYVYYLSRGFVASTRAFNLITRAFNLPTRAFGLLTRGFESVTHGFELLTRGFELVTRGFELVTRGFELVTRVLLFHVHEYITSWQRNLKVTEELPFCYVQLYHFMEYTFFL